MAYVGIVVDDLAAASQRPFSDSAWLAATRRPFAQSGSRSSLTARLDLRLTHSVDAAAKRRDGDQPMDF